MTRTEELKAEGYTVKPCDGCHKPMIWARTPEGKWVPLDPTPPVYTVVPIKGADGYPRPEAARNMLAFVSHFVTCPKRDQFKNHAIPSGATK